MSSPLDLSIIDEILSRFRGVEEDTLSILSEVQKRYGYLPEAVIRSICRHTGLSLSNTLSVASFYRTYRMTPSGKHTIRVCTGTACHMKGAGDVLTGFAKHLGIPEGQDTDASLQFTLTSAPCLGCCSVAPAVQIDDKIYGRVEPSGSAEVIEEFLETTGAAFTSEKSPFEAINTSSISVCLCSACAAAGSYRIYESIKSAISKYRLKVRLASVSCTGISYRSPLVEVITPSGTTRYAGVGGIQAEEILFTHFKPTGIMPSFHAGLHKIAASLTLPPDNPPLVRLGLNGAEDDDRPYLDCQVQVALKDAGRFDPMDLTAYRDSGGWTALRMALFDLSSQKLITKIRVSGLRGRGGGGFSTAEKWQTVSDTEQKERYLICNADEGDPGAFMDRMILESFPLRVIEGMVIAAKTLGIRKGFIYIREEYPTASERFKKAVELCREEKILGPDILDSAFSFDIEVKTGAGAFVCGEETALIQSIQGRRGMPEFKPPFPAVSGLYGKPTLINNVETFALIPSIISDPEKTFARSGTHHSRGTKVFALAGKIRRSGLIEVPMGITLKQIVMDIGGGTPDGSRVKAVLIGGPSGGCIPFDTLCDTPVDFEALTGKGAIMGSGGLVVLDDNDCMVDIARYFIEFCASESCGRCTFCRLGTVQLLLLLNQFCKGEAAPEDIDRLEDICHQVQQGSLCGLGRTAPNPVLTTLRYFREEYLEHTRKICRAKKCKALIFFTINETCIGCSKCASVCPVQAITPEPYHQHRVDPLLCIKCGSCLAVCPVDAVKVSTYRENLQESL